MTITQPLNTQQIDLIVDFLESEQVAEGCLDFIAMHGFLTGLATGPEGLLTQDWKHYLFDGEPEYQSAEQREEIEAIINQQALLIQRALYLGETLELPCDLTVSTEGEANQLTDWCFGFIEALGIDENLWFSDEELTESIAELILPAGILSEQFSDPELEHLFNDNDARQEMANSLIENIQNLYLLYRE